MIVVMAIVSVLSILGAGAFISIRDQYILDSMTEDTVSMVREAQTRAISVSEGAKAWGFSFEAVTPNRIVLLKVDDFSISPFLHIYSHKDLARDATITSIAPNTQSIFFVAPFGTPHIATTRPACTLSGNWITTTKATKEVAPTGSCLSSIDELNLTITHKGRTANIIVNRRGDVQVVR